MVIRPLKTSNDSLSPSLVECNITYKIGSIVIEDADVDIVKPSCNSVLTIPVSSFTSSSILIGEEP